MEAKPTWKRSVGSSMSAPSLRDEETDAQREGRKAFGERAGTRNPRPPSHLSSPVLTRLWDSWHSSINDSKEREEAESGMGREGVTSAHLAFRARSHTWTHPSR